MYMITQTEQVVRIPPSELGKSMEEVIDKQAWSSFEGRFGTKNEFIVMVSNVKPIGDGRIVHGDGAVYQNVSFDQLVYTFKDGEIVDGVVVEVTNYGAFVRFGPLDGLVHIGQIGDDTFAADVVNKRIVGKESGRSIAKDDKVRVRIVSVKINEKNPKKSEIGLTMRQPGLGKLEWIAEDAAKAQE